MLRLRTSCLSHGLSHPECLQLDTKYETDIRRRRRIKPNSNRISFLANRQHALSVRIKVYHAKFKSAKQDGKIKFTLPLLRSIQESNMYLQKTCFFEPSKSGVLTITPIDLSFLTIFLFYYMILLKPGLR